MTKHNVSPLVAREIEFSTDTIFGGTWCRYFISITLHQCYIEATWKTRPKSNLDGHKETFNSLQEYLDWFANLKKTYGRRTSLFIKIKVVIKTSLEIILYICSEKYFSNNFNIDIL